MKTNMKRILPIGLSILGSVGLIVTAILSAKASPKAQRAIDDNNFDDLSERDEVVEKVKITAPYYAPAAVAGGITIACIIGSNVLSMKQQASLLGAYSFLDRSYKKYRGKLIELYGKEADDKIEESIAVEEAKDTYISGECLFSVGSRLPEKRSEPRLFYDEFSKRFFEAPLEQVLDSEYHLNRNYYIFGFESVNDFYEMLGLAPIEGGDEIVWEPYDFDLFWIDFDHKDKTLPDGREYISIEMLYEPAAYSEALKSPKQQVLL